MMVSSANPNFIITIRAAGERTEKLCYDTVAKQAKGAEIVIIREKPFKKALEECYRLGIDSSKKWLITVDADMILLPGSVELLLREAEKMPSHYLQLQGRVYDKITGNDRKAGPRIYRISLLRKLLSASELFEDHIRPESRLITAYGEKGHPSRYIPVVTCLHDFEQYYKDIYRKAYVHANKHSEFLPKMIEISVEKQHEDFDYKVILKALWDGLTENDEVTIDTRLYIEKSKRALDVLEIREKSDLSGDKFKFNKINKLGFLTPKKIKEITYLNNNDQPKQNQFRIGKMNDSLRRRGLLKTVIHAIGSTFINIGRTLQN